MHCRIALLIISLSSHHFPSLKKIELNQIVKLVL